MRQNELTDQLSAPAAADRSAAKTILAQSIQWTLLSELTATRAAATFYELRLRDNDIYREWLAAQRDRTSRKLSEATALADAIQEQLIQQRQLESEAAAAQATEALEAAARLHPCVQSIADRNAK